MELGSGEINQTSKNQREAIATGLSKLTEEEAQHRSLLVLDSHTLGRECLIEGLLAQGVKMRVTGAASFQDWKNLEGAPQLPTAILFTVTGRKFAEHALASETTRLVSDFHSVPVVVLSDVEDPIDMLRALDCGVSGYIPASVSLDVCIEAINLAIAGGIFVPAHALFEFREALNSKIPSSDPVSRLFTPRQTAVVEALRQGKPNKIIAYELNMSESTVKVHVRSIMRKLEARNRTEVVFKIEELR
jgi:DNA-binding NarL/FixJ family response regulator